MTQAESFFGSFQELTKRPNLVTMCVVFIEDEYDKESNKTKLRCQFAWDSRAVQRAPEELKRMVATEFRLQADALEKGLIATECAKDPA
jgi:hypothetical protein